jgi:hypothetical protein
VVRTILDRVKANSQKPFLVGIGNKKIQWQFYVEPLSPPGQLNIVLEG